MDTNGTRFHLLLGRADWTGARLPAGLAWDADTATVRLAPLPFVFPPRAPETAPPPAARAGAGRDRFGNWYWIDTDGRTLLARAPRDAAPRRFWPAETPPECATDAGAFEPATAPAVPAPAPLRGLAVTADHYLVAGTLEPAGLLVFDLAAGGPPVALHWPAAVPFAPFDIAAAPDGGVWLLDRDHARLWSLDRLFRVRAAAPLASPAAEAPDFEPADADGLSSAATALLVPCADAPGAIAASAAVDVSAVTELAGVEALCDGSALLLGRDAPAGAPLLHRYTLEGAAGLYVIAPLLEPHAEVAAQLSAAHDLAYVPAPDREGGAVAGTLFLVAPNGNQAFAFRVDGLAAEPEIRFVEAFYPMRRFGGRGLVTAGAEAYYDSGARWVSLLEQPRPRHVQSATLQLPPAAGAAAEPAAFDGREPGCVWHRLFLDGCVPPGARISVESRAAETRAELAAAAWQREPPPYLRRAGPELPWTGAGSGRGASTDGAGTWELLFQEARGRYLQLRVTLRGSGRDTPSLHALRVYYPRFSYLREYLPAIWREDAASASFVDRYLANIEGTFTELEARIAAAQVLFDTRTVPPEFLDWLAGWLGATLDPAWDESRRRFFLANALRMFAARGTRNGLVRALRLALEDCTDPDLFEGTAAAGRFTVRVVEEFLARRAPGVAYRDVGSAALPGAATGSWTPAHGAEPLHARWRDWLARSYGSIAALNEAWDSSWESFGARDLMLPVLPPGGQAGTDWRRFVRAGLGFTYAVPTSTDLPVWREFLQRRYRQPVDLNRAWRRHGSARFADFDEVPFPAELPAAGAELGDWIAFVSVVLPLRRGAHRFTVLVPVRLDDPPAVQRARRNLAERVAALEKPAHTVVRTRLVWAAFQVGSARVGADTLLGRGSRFAALVIGDAELGASHLGWTEPWNTAGRSVVGRDVVVTRPLTQGAPVRCL
jgi:phage tail-like protein